MSVKLFLSLILPIFTLSKVLNIGGIFDPSYPSEKAAFEQAIQDVNDDNNLFNDFEFVGSYVIDSESSNIKETANMLSTNVSIVIGPRYSKSAEQLSPLFELSRTPYISYRAAGSDLSNRNTFPYFFRTVPDVSLQYLPILNIFQKFKWEQGVLIHSSGIWGRGLNFLVQIGAENGIELRAIEIPDSYTINQISTQLKLLNDYEVFILHVPTNQVFHFIHYIILHCLRFCDYYLSTKPQ